MDVIVARRPDSVSLMGHGGVSESLALETDSFRSTMLLEFEVSMSSVDAANQDMQTSVLTQ